VNEKVKTMKLRAHTQTTILVLGKCDGSREVKVSIPHFQSASLVKRPEISVKIECHGDGAFFARAQDKGNHLRTVKVTPANRVVDFGVT
jgi:hypothetical protein